MSQFYNIYYEKKNLKKKVKSRVSLVESSWLAKKKGVGHRSTLFYFKLKVWVWIVYFSSDSGWVDEFQFIFLCLGASFNRLKMWGFWASDERELKKWSLQLMYLLLWLQMGSLVQSLCNLWSFYISILYLMYFSSAPKKKKVKLLASQWLMCR